MKEKINNKLIVILVSVIVLLILFFAVFSMQAKSISVEGNNQYTDEEIKNYIFDDVYDENILVLWAKTKLGKTETIPFVEKYDVEILSMDKVRVTIYEKSMVGYIDYMGTYMYFDRDGVVVESSSQKIEGIPKVTGIEYEYILLHEKIPVENDDVFDLLLTVTQNLQKYKLEIEKINVTSKLEITLHIDDVKIYLGTDKDLSEKISDLSEFASKLEGRSGTMDMSVLDTEGNGYTLKDTHINNQIK